MGNKHINSLQIHYKYETKYTLTRSYKYQSNDAGFYGQQISSRIWQSFLPTPHWVIRNQNTTDSYW